MRAKRLRLAVLVLAGALPAGCGTPAGGRTTAFHAGRGAPEIEGADADGVAFRLSDYRGKVVLLDFWNDS
jgi:hypothetical protein